MCSRLKGSECIIACEMSNNKCIANSAVKKMKNPLTNRLVIATLPMANNIAKSMGDTTPKEWLEVIRKYQAQRQVKKTVRKPKGEKKAEGKPKKEASPIRPPMNLTDLPPNVLQTIAVKAQNRKLRGVNKLMKEVAPIPGKTKIRKLALKLVMEMRKMKGEVIKHPNNSQYHTFWERNNTFSNTEIRMPNGTSATFIWGVDDTKTQVHISEMHIKRIPPGGGAPHYLVIKYMQRFLDSHFTINFSHADMKVVAFAFFMYFIDDVVNTCLPPHHVYGANYYRGKVFMKEDIIQLLEH